MLLGFLGFGLGIVVVLAILWMLHKPVCHHSMQDSYFDEKGKMHCSECEAK